MLEALSEVVKYNPEIELLLGHGYGPIIPTMEQLILEKSLEGNVKFLGKMDKNEIARTLANTDAYLFSSNYETFSVVCAQRTMLWCANYWPEDRCNYGICRFI